MTFALTAAERNRRQYVRKVQGLVNEMFGLSEQDIAAQNNVWEEWLATQSREWRDLCELLKQDVKDAFKARALSILFAPQLKWSPFLWPEKSARNYLSTFFHPENGKLKFEDLSLRFQMFAVELIELALGAVRGPGFDGNRESVSCNQLILLALPVLEENDPRAGRLFEGYELNDPVPFSGIEDSSGYNPFRAILHSKVPEKWKRLADEKMRSIIRAEREGRAKPRAEWEEAIINYLDHLQRGFYGDQFPYSADLLASQVEFILGLPNPEGRGFFCWWHTAKVLSTLKGDDHKSLRHRFVRHIVLTPYKNERDRFRVYSKDTKLAAVMMVEEFFGSDEELRARLQMVISEGNANLRREEDQAQAKRDQASAALAKMR